MDGGGGCAGERDGTVDSKERPNKSVTVEEAELVQMQRRESGRGIRTPSESQADKEEERWP